MSDTITLTVDGSIFDSDLTDPESIGIEIAKIFGLQNPDVNLAEGNLIITGSGEPLTSERIEVVTSDLKKIAGKLDIRGYMVNQGKDNLQASIDHPSHCF